ncbi:hypothetical protein FRX31_013024 [Thalictrum thalictroides]|uniref:Uncharacterized protein n=1 Tax=Thalictrum thalictroides TaxID=46969 RepID=A0A7J6WKF4_THATH|nr:hypothetical protein FRX31_013024 [Thalictrum thalictroides]
MEMSYTNPSNESLKRYWRRSQYQRLVGAQASRENMRVARLGGKRKRGWNIRITRKLKLGLKILSPIKLLLKLRTAYINMMIRLEGKVGALNGDNFFKAKRINQKTEKNSTNKDSKAAQEFEAKLIFQIYKSFTASRANYLLPNEAK